MSEDPDLLIDAALVPDPDADEEMGASEVAAIADEDVQGSRFRAIRRGVEAIDMEGVRGGALELGCIFQPALGTRFVYARVVFRIVAPTGLVLLSVQPHEVRENEPVRFSFDAKGKLGLKYGLGNAGAELGRKEEFSLYHCAVQGSGEGFAEAIWDFRENPVRRDGIGHEQVLALSFAQTGHIVARLEVNARLESAGLRRLRDLVLGQRHAEHGYQIEFNIPEAPPPAGLARFLPFL